MGMVTRDFLDLGRVIFKFEPLLPPVLGDDHNLRFRPTASCETGVEYRDVGAFPPPRDDDDRDCFLLVAVCDTLDDDGNDNHDKNDVRFVASVPLLRRHPRSGGVIIGGGDRFFTNGIVQRQHVSYLTR
mmetsp:Transcript_64535/g.76410  ORF Transcript_64535/g.76410 Transcript_64535/m.76410 type:complete len:129 (+) Transcript_64535:829-1215(+)